MRISNLFVAVAALIVAPSSAIAMDFVEDEDIRDAVEREFLYDRAVPSNDVDVMTTDGIVTLEGTVPSILAKDRAVRIAETVKGVRAVIDRTAVDPATDRADDAVRKDVEDALLADPAADSYELTVTVDDGAVALAGTVESWAEKRLAETVAKGVKGVRSVQNRITVAYEADRPDREIRSEVEQSLRWNHLVDDGLIEVAVQDGVVSLSGTVGSAAERRQARYDAWTAGVTDVDDSGLEVARWARDDDLRKDKYVIRSDDAILRAVEKALLHDPRVTSFDVRTAASGGKVSLHGVVDNLRAKRAAEQDAENTVGVVSVENYLKVRPVERREDSEIADDVRSALLRDPYVERYEVAVRAYDGTVHLSGTVDSLYEKSRADDIASRVDGVVDVVNALEADHDRWSAYDPWVDPWSIYSYGWYAHEPTFAFESDAEIEEAIEAELFWSPFVDADEVNVSVEDGVVTLTGTVDSAMEKGAARDNAYEGGATYVRNLLKVEVIEQ